MKIGGNFNDYECCVMLYQCKLQNVAINESRAACLFMDQDALFYTVEDILLSFFFYFQCYCHDVVIKRYSNCPLCTFYSLHHLKSQEHM